TSSAVDPERSLPVVTMRAYVDSFLEHEALLRSFVMQIVPSSSILNRGVHFGRYRPLLNNILHMGFSQSLLVDQVADQLPAALSE
ncbi:hypothetical protein NQU49_26155, partial [Escherichia coli]|uniref:hypothetical protein n=1 Tax=Escherichia coli TaxID=562 RepID=UPI002118E80D